MKTNVIIGTLAVVFIVGIGAYAVSSNGTGTKMMTDEAMVEKDSAMMEGDEAMVEKDGAMMEGDEAMMKKGTYAEYSPETLAMAKSGKTLLFFKADWCPTCRALDADITANLDMIPAGVTILEVNYDTATDLKQKYGVTTQHTLVQIDANGTLVSKMSGGNTLAIVTANIK
jgi:thiol-disulfide isomerase/thioredoxin